MILFHSGLSRDFDGPGLRLVFYLKGCNFHCDWCASPESISPIPEILYYKERNQDTKGCHCPEKAYSENGNLNREICKRCSAYHCINIWHNPAFELAGEKISAEGILKKTEKYSGLIDGVTFGGGEPTLQEELPHVIRLLKTNGFHTALESNASTPFYQNLIGEVDLLYSDLKTLNPEIVRTRIKGDLSLVKDNLMSAARNQKDFILRIPVIRGVNTDAQDQEEIVSFCCNLQNARPDKLLNVELLRQHHLGEPKYNALGKQYLLQGKPAATQDEVNSFGKKMEDAGIRIKIFA